ncbi:MAG TPA: histidinol-phosphatase [Actinomycetes bacterium]|nr:histidinol-phosphatase [Actinomycetes bacterium]
METDLELALTLADHADRISLPRFGASDLIVQTKPDMSPVTDTDRAVEEALRALLASERPTDTVVGEEFGDDGGTGTRWILDPIDGTKNFIRGVPVWGTLIAVERDGELVVGVVTAPAMGRRWWAARGAGAYADGRPIRVSRVRALADAHLSHASFVSWERHGRGERFLGLARRVWRTRGFGDFWQHMLVAEGGVDVAVEPEVELWDLAPIQVIVEEAGGRFSDLSGTPRPDGGNAVTTNGLLHEEVLAALA